MRRRRPAKSAKLAVAERGWKGKEKEGEDEVLEQDLGDNQEVVGEEEEDNPFLSDDEDVEEVFHIDKPRAWSSQRAPLDGHDGLAVVVEVRYERAPSPLQPLTTTHMIWLSAQEVARVELSCALHSMDMMGWRAGGSERGALMRDPLNGRDWLAVVVEVRYECAPSPLHSPTTTHVIWLSPQEVASVDISCGLYSMDVMGWRWWLKCAMKAPPSLPAPASRSKRRSQMRKEPSSHPDTTMQLASLGRGERGGTGGDGEEGGKMREQGRREGRRSQMRKDPSSHPNATMQLANLRKGERGGGRGAVE
ncbi:unnamed protein product [Closterium sp. Naga37s-1]|nr:unnamed protein product [Closterium sp. Naga37s-1]